MLGRFMPLFIGAASLLLGDCSETGKPDGGPPQPKAGCPQITSWALAPLVTSVGGRVDLHAAAISTTDAGSAVVVKWGAVRGQIDAPSADTTFTCLTGGDQAITLTATAANCDSVARFSVFCVPPTCGDGHLDPGEQCDPPNGTTCLDGCSLPCGNGLIEPGEDCDPPDGRSCSATCRFVYP